MSTEICQLCNTESTPWTHINGHICEDCYFNSKNSNWINVKDKLPEIGEKALILINSSEIEMAYRTNEGNKELGIVWFYPENNGWTEKEVTYWMPLPELPND